MINSENSNIDCILFLMISFLRNFLVDGNWGAFGVWSACSVTCGGGRKSRERLCDNPAPASGGKPCSGSSIEERSCRKKSCPGM